MTFVFVMGAVLLGVILAVGVAIIAALTRIAWTKPAVLAAPRPNLLLAKQLVGPGDGGTITLYAAGGDWVERCEPGHCHRCPIFTGGSEGPCASDTRHGADRCSNCGAVFMWCGDWHFRGRGELEKNGGVWDGDS
jgi:hypothetical protein